MLFNNIEEKFYLTVRDRDEVMALRDHPVTSLGSYFALAIKNKLSRYS